MAAARPRISGTATSEPDPPVPVRAETGEADAEAGEADAEAGEADAEAGEVDAEAGEVDAETGEVTVTWLASDCITEWGNCCAVAAKLKTSPGGDVGCGAAAE